VHKNTPWVFYSIVFIGVLFLFSLWFFLHPNSPWHSRNYYLVAFNEIGNLKVDNAVKINGLTKGYVKEFELTDSCVWAKIAVLSAVKIPLDSKLRVANAGLMGERVVEVGLGNSKEYYKNEAQISGDFDKGGTAIGVLTMNIVDEAQRIADILATAADTLFSDKKMEDYKRLGQKAKTMGNRTTHIFKFASQNLTVSIDSLTQAVLKIEEIINNVKPNFNNAIENVELLKKNLANLKKALEKVKDSVAAIAEKLEGGDNTISLSLDKNQNGALRNEMMKISRDAEKLMEQIKKQGMDLNVDIF
jgi:phospholipid/cholesterol/gamma-HCH transport system substrate-binding protein